MFPNIFRKPCNKWWCGYNGESEVLIDDLDGGFLFHYLKIWGDRYAIDGEVKGGRVALSYSKMIITSNYSI